ncbi:MAG: T9SS type A sorting domain-containing protein [Bacteroidales bacterium]|nr:T9SS type A sorting domain-containing protein [Bacteroidales bacterium]
MNKVILSLICLVFGTFAVNGLIAQCTPGDSISCPDLENNGEICPEIMPGAVVNQLYHEDFTILAPPAYVDSVTGLTISLHHIKLMEIGNLPEGISWVSNTPDSVFMVGPYYCVLLEGTPTVAGNYPLKIVVDVFVEYLGNLYYLATVADSLSLSMDVNTSGIQEFGNTSMMVLGNSPNPFSTALDIFYFMPEPQEVTFKLFDLPGKLIYEEIVNARFGENHIIYNGSALKPGIYIYSISDGQNQFTQRIIKSK